MALQNNEQLLRGGTTTMPSHDASQRAQERMPTMANDQERDRERLIEVLQRELDAARTREQVALERAERLEQVALEREERLLALLERLPLQHQLSREGRQSSHTAVASPQQGHTQSQRYVFQSILEVLQGYPEGLHREEIQRRLGMSKNLSDSLVNLVRRKRLVRVSKGTYALPPG